MLVRPTPLRQKTGRLLAAGALALSLSFAAPAAPTQQLTFSSTEAAVAALVDAVRSGDKAHLKKLLGPKSERLIAADPVIAQREQAIFVAAFEQGHDIQMEGQKKASLVVGRDNWPFPVPLVNTGKGWRFDTSAGLQEILHRRIGRNELNAIQVLLAIVDAQREYASADHDGDGLIEYAPKFESDPGKKNGLYWPTQPGEHESPLGPLVARATRAGYASPEVQQAAQPYWGYYYRLLVGQGAAAKGGAYSYMAGSRMLGGFAVVAYPAHYGNSAVKSFIVNQDGTVFEKDLGPKSKQIAEAMTAFNPDKGWEAVATADGK
ncbi:MAG TPA: DUF2950 domain-containing protein [Azonexus sp.]